MGEVPHHYLSQVLLNLEICNLEVAHFIEFVPPTEPGGEDYTINIVEVNRDREWFSKELPKMKEFWDEVLLYRRIGIHTHPKYIKQQERKEKARIKKAEKDKNDKNVVLDLTSSFQFIDEN